jgi:hypothetical protein
LITAWREIEHPLASSVAVAGPVAICESSRRRTGSDSASNTAPARLPLDDESGVAPRVELNRDGLGQPRLKPLRLGDPARSKICNL